MYFSLCLHHREYALIIKLFKINFSFYIYTKKHLITDRIELYTLVFNKILEIIQSTYFIIIK